jgi:hypothetical protein
MTITNSFNNRLVSPFMVFGSDATGDVYYRASTGFLTRLPVGTNGQILGVTSGLPAWQTGVTPSGSAGGDLTGTYPNPTIASAAVTFAKFQNISTATFLGRTTAGTGSVEALTASQFRGGLGLGTAALTDTGTSVGNVPVLQSGGLLDPAVLPPIALNSIQVVADQTARLALSNVEPGDGAKQTDNGITYILSVLPASTNGNWVPIGDTAIDASDIASGTIATARLGSGTANSGTYLRGDQTWAAVPGGSLAYTEVTGTTLAIVAGNAYGLNNASLVTATLPATAAIGTVIEITGIGAGGWRIAQNASQVIHFGNLDTTTGNTGRIDSTHRRDAIRMFCVVANTEWNVVSSQGNLDVI